MHAAVKKKKDKKKPFFFMSLHEPLDFFRLLLKQQVTVQQRCGRDLIGTLVGFDEHCNLMLSHVEEINRKTAPPIVRNFDLLYVRGDGILVVSTK